MAKQNQENEPKSLTRSIRVQMSRYKATLSFDEAESPIQSRSFLEITVDPGANKEEAAENYGRAFKAAKAEFRRLKNADLPDKAWLEIVLVENGEVIKALS